MNQIESLRKWDKESGMKEEEWVEDEG